MSRISIRSMTPEDFDQVSRIYCQGIESGNATFETVCPDFARWDSSHLPRCRVVAEQDGSVLGWAALSPVSHRAVYSGVAEVSVYVARESRRSGVGALLLTELAARSEQAGIWTLQSVIFSDNPSCIGLHSKCGFRMVGYRERIGKDSTGQWRTTVLMERRSANIN